MKRLVVFVCILGIVWLVPGSPGLGEDGRANTVDKSSDRVTGLSGAPRYEFNYSMTARIRLLLFWLSFKNVGTGRIGWSETPERVSAIELLIGSDPLSAPMKVNRWGYLSERRVDSRFDLIGVMTQADEESVQQAKKNLESGGAVHVFKAIRASVEGGTAESITHHIPSKTEFTIRDLEALLAALPTSGGRSRRLSLPQGTEPGFLLAVKSLIHESVENFRRTGKAKSAEKARRVYVFNGALHEVNLASVDLKEKFKIAGESYPSVLEGKFKTKNLESGNTEEFRVAYGTQGPNSEVPLQIVYRPNWWFEAMLQIVPRGAGG